MIALVRQDLHDEVSTDYRWTDLELTRHIGRAVKEYSQAVPLEQKATLVTVAGSREISITTLTDRIIVEAVEYPVGNFPPTYQRFALWNDIITLLGEEIPDGSNCYIYYGKLHTLSTTSTLQSQHEDLIAAGAAGYAALQLSNYVINQVNAGGTGTPEDWAAWAKEKLAFFRAELKRLGRKSKVVTRQLYTPYYPVKSQTTDWGP